VVGSASGRGWIGFEKDNGSSRSTLLLGSLRSVGGRLSFAKTTLDAGTPMMIVGSQLVYHVPGASGLELRTAPLLSNGRVGTPRAVPDDPEKIPPQQFHPGVLTGIQVGDRLVWVLGGARKLTGQLDFLWACCTSTGELSDLSRFIDHKRDMRSLQLERDARGRLWLAWLDVYLRKGWGAVKMVELDPDTLVPRTAKPFVTPAPDSWVGPELVCADSCRIVVQDLGGAIFSWAPRERSATRIVSGSRTSPAGLLAASFRSGGLEVASGRYLHLNKPPWDVEEISVTRGDARGAHARRLGSVAPVPFATNVQFQWQYPAYAAFVPGGLVFFENYSNSENDATRFLAGFLPLGR
jgi:hypothetical protein